MNVDQLINLCDDFASDGSSVQGQFRDVVNGRLDDCNPNTLRIIIAPFFRKADRMGVEGAQGIVADIEEYLNS